MVHDLRACMDKHCENDDFAVVKVDMRNMLLNWSPDRPY